MMTDNEIGEHIAGDPRGLLMFTSLSAELARLEDQRLHADHEHIHEGMFDAFTRLATATERELLGHLGYSVPATLTTRVNWLSNGVRRRSWPQLEGS